jgi:hypothetical protein
LSPATTVEVLDRLKKSEVVKILEGKSRESYYLISLGKCFQTVLVHIKKKKLVWIHGVVAHKHE